MCCDVLWVWGPWDQWLGGCFGFVGRLEGIFCCCRFAVGKDLGSFGRGVLGAEAERGKLKVDIGFLQGYLCLYLLLDKIVRFWASG